MSEFTLNDAASIIKRKILVNRMSLEQLQNNAELINATVKLHGMGLAIIEKKKILIASLNEVMERQLSEFTAHRQNECKEIYDAINKLDEPTEEYLEAVATCKKYEEMMLDLQHKINYLEESVPESQMVTNYKMKPT